MLLSSTSTEFDSLLDYLYNLQRLGIKVGLSHTRELLGRCSNPQDHFQSIHVAGTNGKGSTCAITASILMESGLKVGLYSSPHLIRFNERIRVNGEPITDDEIVTFVYQYKNDIDAIESTFFETTTAMAFDHFRNHRVDVAIIETGLGGRLDSTNVLKPVLTAITPISMDHRDILGDNILAIANEKAGIIKRNTPVLISNQDMDVEALLIKTAESQNAPITTVTFSDDIQYDKSGTAFDIDGEEFITPLLGQHQAVNAALAVYIAKTFNPKLFHDIIQKGLTNTQWPGRLQVMSTSPTIFYDVAHNAEGIGAVLRTVNQLFDCRPIGLFVMKGDKESNLIVSALQDQFEKLIISGGTKYGLLTGKALGNILSDKGLKNFSINNSFPDALNDLIDLSREELRPALIFGSHYVAKEIFDKFGFLI
ncbi:MAG: folylpolyglutamate synthase/dihydrofolate synthase family protein [Candidatus Marinimicrobia bacterium]|jgi:dihydrofolate synthase/folylpolyglutamate synthase|nr:folylpolyglutamate synthase/dihydrofolate synthase family protein [Candidatus Neomarinimicrobiota bacterium]